MSSFIWVFYVLLIYAVIQTLINTRIYPYLIRMIPRHPILSFALTAWAAAVTIQILLAGATAYLILWIV